MECIEIITIGIVDDDLEYINYEGSHEDGILCKNIKLCLYLNLAACYLKIYQLRNAIAACDEALLLDINNPKAL